MEVLKILCTLLFSIALCAGQGSIRQIDPEIQKEIDDFMNDVYFPLSNVTKLGLAIVQNNGQVLYTTGYGLADEEKGVPNTNQTQFLVASITKVKIIGKDYKVIICLLLLETVC